MPAARLRAILPALAAVLLAARPSHAQLVSGDLSARFHDPSPSCPPSTCTGLGTARLEWGQPLDATRTSNVLEFTAHPFTDVPVGTPFVIGSIFYHNGTTVLGTTLDHARLDFDFTFVGGAPFTIETFLTMVSTPNTTIPLESPANADYVTFQTPGFNVSFHVIEESDASADLLARLVPDGSVTPSGVPGGVGILASGYSVQLLGLVNPTAGGFVTTATPEPATVALLAPALLALGGLAARRRRA